MTDTRIELFDMNKVHPSGRTFTKESFTTFPGVVYCTTEDLSKKQDHNLSLNMDYVVGRIKNITIEDNKIYGDFNWIDTNLANGIKKLEIEYIPLFVGRVNSITKVMGKCALFAVIIKSKEKIT